MKLTAHSAGFLSDLLRFPLWAAAHRERYADYARHAVGDVACDGASERRVSEILCISLAGDAYHSVVLADCVHSWPC